MPRPVHGRSAGSRKGAASSSAPRSQNPPNDCELVNVNPSPTPGGGAAPSPTAGPVDPATPSKQPTTTPGETTPKPTVPKGKSDGAAATGLGLVTAAVGILGALAL